jgi:hypothetical protein
MTSSSARPGVAAGDGANAHRVVSTCAFSALTRVFTASSRSVSPSASDCSISSRLTMSASMLLIARTIFACWRDRLAESAAPRGPWVPVGSPAATEQELTETSLGASVVWSRCTK